MSENHQKFLSHLAASEKAVWTVAQWLSSLGTPVQLLPHTTAPTAADWQSHTDHGDLYVLHRIEIKHLSRNFSSPADWPFGTKFIVCAKHSFDSASPKPYAYVILNQSMTTAAIILTSTRPNWYVEKKSDSRYNNVSQDFYLAPLNLVKFSKIPQE